MDSKSTPNEIWLQEFGGLNALDAARKLFLLSDKQSFTREEVAERLDALMADERIFPTEVQAEYRFVSDVVENGVRMARNAGSN